MSGSTTRVLGVVLLCMIMLAMRAHARSWFSNDRDAQAARPGEISAVDLPPEAQRTLAAIRNGGPFPYRKDGIVFGNYEKLLPYRPRGYYTEYTVRTPGRHNRGARRIIAGGDPRTSGIYYYTEDHYQSFRRIRE